MASSGETRKFSAKSEPEKLLHLSERLHVAVRHDRAVDGGPEVGRNWSDVGKVIGESTSETRI